MKRVVDKIAYDITADASKFRRELRVAGKDFERFSRRNRYAIRDFTRALTGGAAAATAIGVAVAGASVKLAGDFESALVSAGAKSSATEQQLYSLRKEAIQVGLDTAFSGQQAGEGFGFLAQAGYDAGEQIQALQPITNVAAAEQLGLGEATELTTGILKGFGLAVSETTRVTDVMVKASTSASTTASQLGEAMSYVSPVSRALGISLEESAASAAILAEANIKGSRAGTALRGTLAQLIKVSKKLGAGLELADIESLGLVGSLELLQEHGLTAKNALELFGTEAGPGVAQLLNSGTAAIREMTVEMERSGGTAEAIAKKQLDTLNGAFVQLKGTIETVGIVIGTEFTPPVKVAAEQTTVLANSLVDAEGGFRDVRDEVVEMASSMQTVIKVTAVLAGTLRLTGAVLQTITGLMQAIIGAGAAIVRTFEAMWHAMQAGSAAVTGQMEAADYWMQQAQSAMDGAGDFANKAASGITDIGAAWDDALTDVEDYGDMMRQVNGELATFESRAKDASDWADFLADNEGQTMSVLPDAAIGFTPADSMSGLQSTLPEGVDVFGGSSAPGFDTGKTDKAASSTKKLTDEVKAFADQVNKAAMGPVEVYYEQLALLGKAKRRNLIDTKDFGRVLEHIKKQYDPVTKAVEELREESERLKESLKHPSQKYADEVDRLNEMLQLGMLDVDQYDQALKNLNIEYGGSAAAAEELKQKAEQLRRELKSSEEVAEETRRLYAKMFDEGLLKAHEYLEALDLVDGSGLSRIADPELDAKLARDSEAAQAQATRMKEAAEASRDEAKRWASAWQSAVSEAFTTTADSAIGAFFSSLEGETADAKQQIKELTASLLKLGARAAILGALQAGGAESGIGALGFATGGYVSGPGTSTSDSIPARLSNGEYVIQAPAVREYGVGFMEMVNRQALAKSGPPRRFADGGAVSGGGGGDVYVGNFVDPALFEEFLLSARGKNAMLNVMDGSSAEFAHVSGGK